jgi:hypothetical protein
MKNGVNQIMIYNKLEIKKKGKKFKMYLKEDFTDLFKCLFIFIIF